MDPAFQSWKSIINIHVHSHREKSKMKVISALLFILLIPAAARYTLGVKDSFMIAHSFHNHPSFGPAGGMVRRIESCQFC